ncbi:hypothetical protein HC031_10130 [Planosporangium thailandense]|uniref:Uncharacterized protein n=1 Tax=Planosporangium thailandense TaxID=765197 RepID=A0ABX0XVJ3_9ACTN|nr:hypothetical protein [Planosporangium thailandense]NJC70064.1 hypothetical protein [Planosporangium thailandense]
MVETNAWERAEGGLEREPPVLPRIRPVPRWIAPLFACLAVATVPWTIYLAATLPHVIRTRHYRIAWVGFDIGLVLLLLLTSVLAYRGQRHTAMTATATATALVIDAWFDVLTSPPGRELMVAIVTALVGELPLAALCLWIALQVDRVIARRLQQLARRAERGGRWPRYRRG